MGMFWIWQDVWLNQVAGSGAVPDYQQANKLNAKNNVVDATAAFAARRVPEALAA